MGNEILDPSPEDFLTGRALPPDMVEALHAIAHLDREAVARITEYLSSIEGIPSNDELTRGIVDRLSEPDTEAADNIVRTLLNTRPSEIDEMIGRLDRWRHGSEARKQFFSEQQFSAFASNLRLLAAGHRSVTLLKKANGLLRAVGNELDEIAFFCDMRPVFDNDRKHIDGFVLLANMRMIYRSQENTQHCLELALSESELREVITAGNAALTKLEIMKFSIARFA